LKNNNEKTNASRRTHVSGKVKNGHWILKLYIAGRTPKSVKALNNLKLICQDQLDGQCRIEVIDLLLKPKLARDDQILAIPTLVRKLPLPMKRIIGDLSDTEKVLIGLDIINHD